MPKGGTKRTNAVDAQVGANPRTVGTSAGLPTRQLAAVLRALAVAPLTTQRRAIRAALEVLQTPPD